MEFVLPIATLFIGLAVGAICTWMLLNVKAKHAYDLAKSESMDRAMLTERLQSRDQSLSDAKAEIDQKKIEIRELQSAVTGLKERQAQLVQALKGEREQAQEKLAVLEDAQKKLSDAFKALASEALNSNNQSFLELAKTTLEKFQETAKGDLEKRQLAITELVKPVKESLEKVDVKIQDIEKARVGAYEGLTQQVKSLLDSQKELRCETSNLVNALRHRLSAVLGRDTTQTCRRTGWDARILRLLPARDGRN